MKHKFISRILTIVLSVVAVSGLASCGTKKIEYIDDQSVRLNLDYKGKDFYKDGVAEVTLKTCIDGDTAHFSPIAGSSNMDTIKSRFFGIDTPESTGKVEPYGKAASNFTKEKLKTASEKGTIVVSSAQDYYGKPNPDSTGERYVTLIWVCLDKKMLMSKTYVYLTYGLFKKDIAMLKMLKLCLNMQKSLIKQKRKLKNLNS